ncbi:hypothetical protein G8770_04250 [Aestuariicella hydrocarbonica]|uniref:Uncharacterized protein n=1 Tax=Pseudomaricurvus hydrocarbonicus TaxID=1470433 RepID=A0A9E5JSR7_9GAMM|nr:hypothetical protein [Aestuariicella hydrocarbonica]NHO64756.1 hypothetical protein [Aestuariicella hydrocarbonica]
MHLAYLEQTRQQPDLKRRSALKSLGCGALLAGIAPGMAFGGGSSSPGFKGEGRMGMSTGEDWIDTFFTGGASEIIEYYADDFVFEDITFFQAIDDKETLYRAFLPFDDSGPDAPLGVHHFDIIRYDGGPAGDRKGIARQPKPGNYTEEEWDTWSKDTLMGIDHDYDEWAVMNWVWRAKHNMDDFLGIKGCKGKTTHTRGITFHQYRERKIVREFTYWNFRDVAIQLGAAQPAQKFWLPDTDTGSSNS